MTKVGFLFAVFVLNLWSLGHWMGTPGVSKWFPISILIGSVVALCAAHPHMRYYAIRKS